MTGLRTILWKLRLGPQSQRANLHWVGFPKMENHVHHILLRRGCVSLGSRPWSYLASETWWLFKRGTISAGDPVMIIGLWHPGTPNKKIFLLLPLLLFIIITINYYYHYYSYYYYCYYYYCYYYIYIYIHTHIQVDLKKNKWQKNTIISSIMIPSVLLWKKKKLFFATSAMRRCASGAHVPSFNDSTPAGVGERLLSSILWQFCGHVMELGGTLPSGKLT